MKFIYKTKNKNTHSVAIFNSNIREQIINYNPDLLILHWLGNELISLKDLDSLKIPKVWVLHDMWPYCGAEHYTTSERFIEGYNPTNRPDYEKGFDLNKWVFERKKKYLDKNIKIIATSNWQLDNSKKSFLLKQNKILKIPLPINTNFWKPFNKLEARKILGWEKDKTYFLFGFSDSRLWFGSVSCKIASTLRSVSAGSGRSSSSSSSIGSSAGDVSLINSSSP